MQKTDTVHLLAFMVFKHVDFVSERASLGRVSGQCITMWRQLFPSVLDKRVSMRLLFLNKKDELIFEIGQTTLEGRGASP